MLGLIGDPIGIPFLLPIFFLETGKPLFLEKFEQLLRGYVTQIERRTRLRSDLPKARKRNRKNSICPRRSSRCLNHFYFGGYRLIHE